MDNEYREKLLKAFYELLVKCAEGPYVKDALGVTVEIDGTECDGYSLANDVAAELDLPELP